MKTILVINDNSTTAEHAAKFALKMAQMLRGRVLLAHNCPIEVDTGERVLTGELKRNSYRESNNVFDRLVASNSTYDGFKPEIDEINISGKTDSELVEFINQDHIWMVVKGVTNSVISEAHQINLNSILNRVQCPLMLVPEKWRLKKLAG